MRLDNYLVLKGYFDSRTKAQSIIKSKLVKVNDKIIDKPSFDINDNDVVLVTKDNCPYVSRGGLKLEEAIKVFNLDFKDKVVLDIGSSTGGFTDCAIKHGARLVYAVDVGRDQLHESLKNNPKVISYEETNIKDIDSFENKIDYVVMDVSFVSIEYIIEYIYKFVSESDAFMCLIKPQFEVGKMYLKNGIVKDKNLYRKVLENIIAKLSEYNLGIVDIRLSPIKGGSGNKEFISLIKKGESKININAFLGDIDDKKISS